MFANHLDNGCPNTPRIRAILVSAGSAGMECAILYGAEELGFTVARFTGLPDENGDRDVIVGIVVAGIVGIER